MTPEQRAELYALAFDIRDRKTSLTSVENFVDAMLAAERAAVTEYVVAWLASAAITTTQQEDALRAAIRKLEENSARAKESGDG